MHRSTHAVLALAILTPGSSAQAQEEAASSLQEALGGGRTWLTLNYRVEHADQDTFNKNAFASTLRTALGYESASFHDFRGLVEFEDITNIGNELYNSTTNGIGDRPVVADPDSTEVNQAYITYSGVEDVVMKLGRQEIVYGNHRFVGNVAWRQNHQSYDAARADWTAPSGTKFSYAYLDAVHRIFGETSPKGQEQMSSHLIDVRHPIAGVGEFAAYGYLLDFDRSQKLSSTTLGARFSGRSALSESADGPETSLLYTGEFAHQEDVAGNPIHINADYWLAELGLDFGGLTVRVGNEHLGGSGAMDDKFSTPLATLHKFNGFADVFLNTPDTGLEDRYLSVSGKLGLVTCTATYHVFEADSGSADYGDEIDFTAVYPITDRIKLGGKVAHFVSDDVSTTDIDRAMAWVTYRVL